MFRKLLLITLLCSFQIFHASASCRFQLRYPEGVTCYLENVYATSIDDVIDLSGTHADGTSDTNVTDLVLEYSTFMEEIPSIIFATFENLERFSIVNNRLRRVELINCGSRMSEIVFNGNPIGVLQNGAFRGCPSLSRVTIWWNQIQDVEEDALAGMTNLKFLDFYMNYFPVIRRNLFRDQTQLETLWLPMNRISSIEPGAFQTLASLVSLNAYSNEIEKIASGTFVNMPKLERVDLSMNSISSIEAGAFGNLPTLFQINLDYNLLTVLDAGFFSTAVPSFVAFNLYGNPINAIDRNFFGRLPNIQVLIIEWSPCVENSDGRFIMITNVETDVFPYIQTCLMNFE